MNFKRHIPNTITCCNLISGCIAICFAFFHEPRTALMFIILGAVFDFFDDVRAIEKEENLDHAIDEIRDRFGFTSLQRATSLMEGSRVIERSKLIGGHCGGMDGLE